MRSRQGAFREETEDEDASSCYTRLVEYAENSYEPVITTRRGFY